MTAGFDRLHKCEYKMAYNDFNAAYVLDDISEEQKYKALYFRNVSDSCLKFRSEAEMLYENGNFELASVFYQKVYSLNSYDSVCLKKFRICNAKMEVNRNSKRNRMVFIPSCEFVMGNKNGKENANIEHRVVLSKFMVDKYEVSNQEYANYLNSIRISPQSAKKYIDLDDLDCKIFYKNGFYLVKNGYNNYPVVEVSWYGAESYARYYGKRLPTEAEWEYLASSAPDVRSNLYSPVGVGIANKYGVFNLNNNVREWCEDYYWKNFYRDSPVKDPLPVNDCDYRVVRGAAYNTAGRKYYVRDFELPSETSANLGFRCVKDLR
jgi:formylglycine-generating enzyme required for sulfatase activity